MFQFSINGTNLVIEYSETAIDGLGKAYTLFPNNIEKRLETFSLIFAKKYKSEKGWKAGQSCKKIISSGNISYVEINVDSKDDHYLVKIFK